MRKLLLFSVVLGSLLACKKEEEPTPPVVQKTTYSFDNLDVSGQHSRIQMLSEIIAYAESANEAGISVDAQKLKDMFANTNYTWQNPDLQGVTKDIRSKTYVSAVSIIEAWMDSLAAASNSTNTGSQGVAGRVTSQDGTKTVLLTSNGFEPAEIIEKVTMGACFYYQAATIYLGDDKMNVDNTSVTPGQGTAMQHHWDEAFGYLGVPVGFPEVNGDLYFWGKYLTKANIIDADTKLIQALIEGRKAIDSKNYDNRDKARTDVKTNWELVCVSTALHYLNSAKANISDPALRNHALSEAWAFIYSLQFNIDKKISNADWQQVMDAIGDDLYQITLSDINQAQDVLATAYGLENVKNQL